MLNSSEYMDQFNYIKRLSEKQQGCMILWQSFKSFWLTFPFTSVFNHNSLLTLVVLASWDENITTALLRNWLFIYLKNGEYQMVNAMFLVGNQITVLKGLQIQMPTVAMWATYRDERRNARRKNPKSHERHSNSRFQNPMSRK